MLQRLKTLVFALALALACASNAQAETWFSFARTFNGTALYFFDVDSVVSRPGAVSVLIKHVTDPKYPDTDGTYATGQKFSFSCVNHTYQILATTTFDRAGTLILTYPDAGPAQAIPAGSVVAALQQIACAPDFPHSRGHDSYFPVPGNNIVLYTARYFENMRDSSNDSSPN